MMASVVRRGRLDTKDRGKINKTRRLKLMAETVEMMTRAYR